MATEEKDFISAFLGSLIVVDGHIDDKEMTLWKFISTICGFPTMNIQTAIERFPTIYGKMSIFWQSRSDEVKEEIQDLVGQMNRLLLRTQDSLVNNNGVTDLNVTEIEDLSQK